jgi:anti-anti-sigma regulatory factor
MEESMISVSKISDNEVVLEFSKNVSPEQAETVFNDILRSTYQKIIVDFSGLIHLGHRLLGKLYMFNMDLQISRRKLILTGCSDKIRSLLHLTRVDQDIDIENGPYQGLRDDRLS